MLKRFRHLLLLAGAIAMVASPCAPALAAGSSSCTMPGCEDSPYGSVRSAACCCGEASAPAQGAGQTSFARSPVKTAASAPSPEMAAAASAPATGIEVQAAPPARVPLFLLNASLLI
jgi:hypothetical protein